MIRYRRRGTTLVESLVVITVIGLLMSLLLPAVQSARESGRRVVCVNHLKQMGLGLHLHHQVHGRLPPGITSSRRMFWTGSLLPFLEQQALAESVDPELPWDSGDNATVCATYLPIFRCPTSTAPRQMTAQGIVNRSPSDYLACVSGTATRESGPPPLAGEPDSDGLFFIDSRTRLADILDGLSHTVALGESVFIYESMGIDLTGSPQFVDRWTIGTFEGVGNEVSEGMGSTGVAINSHRLDVMVDEIELSFGSQHPGGAHIGFADGAVRLIRESIDPLTWSAMGTRNGAEAIGSPGGQGRPSN